jgi:uncharacterized protein (TIGR02145 family)
MDYVGGYGSAGSHLKSKSGWNLYSGIEDLDTYGFSALPGGTGSSDGSFSLVGGYGYWWSANEENNSSFAHTWDMNHRYDYAYRNNHFKSSLFSIRCLQD